MNKTKLVIIIFLSFVFIAICTYKIVCTVKNTTYQEIPFKMTKTGHIYIQKKIHGKNFNLLLDTGAECSVLNPSGIKKIFGSVGILYPIYMADICMQFDTEYSYMWHKKEARELISMYLAQGHLLAVRLDGNLYGLYLQNDKVLKSIQKETNDTLHGILGEEFFKKFKNVVFDYQQKKVLFNAENISETGMPIYWTGQIQSLPTIEFSINGVLQKGLIDTGSDGFSVYDGIESLVPELKKTESDEFIIPSLEIGAIPYNDKKANIHFNKHMIVNEKSRKRLQKEKLCCLGYPFFKDHVIQLDFEHNEFRIK